ncbi:MAG: hypothetical protein COV72_02045 [Candidatus Omnitrophica bacterium CG11_big_fil_rev_8_21_14_0_20_42_13]|uniref:Nucleotidyl transferase domain-containing protein n=1 Tax=Candidatus Ghiorseimicrobium undicola TaxID=1974746 RepID=A0A2H0LYW3_9BACT|nr:MAG: hypothetical protein COV72_02045 [Candidatus Omnitrophica bacterium CG11_big_fil_rev_8_21_14_0_20_42_13]
MNKNIKAHDTDVIILCGGEGRRLQSVVGDRPKPLAELNNRPFLDILIEHISNFGFRRFILCSGYMKDKIRGYYQSKSSSLAFIFSEEDKPLGTAGAIKNAQSYIQSDPFLVANADSFCDINLNEFINFYVENNAKYLICLAKACDSDSFGSVKIDAAGRILEFKEKNKPGSCDFVNAGIYLLAKDILKIIPEMRKVSIEHEIFPGIINDNLMGYRTNQSLLDIGTPENYEKAKLIFRK